MLDLCRKLSMLSHFCCLLQSVYEQFDLGLHCLLIKPFNSQIMRVRTLSTKNEKLPSMQRVYNINSLHAGEFFVVCRYFSKLTFSKKSFRNTVRVSNGLNPDQASALLCMIWVRTVCKGYQ